jgi:hypothetical protein
MHKIDIPHEVVDRVIRHRGRAHVYDEFDPARTALLVVDMQNAFMMPGVAHNLCREAVDIVPNINRLASEMRAASAPSYGSSAHLARLRSRTGPCCTKWRAPKERLHESPRWRRAASGISYGQILLCSRATSLW